MRAILVRGRRLRVPVEARGSAGRAARGDGVRPPRRRRGRERRRGRGRRRRDRRSDGRRRRTRGRAPRAARRRRTAGRARAARASPRRGALRAPSRSAQRCAPSSSTATRRDSDRLRRLGVQAAGAARAAAAPAASARRHVRRARRPQDPSADLGRDGLAVPRPRRRLASRAIARSGADSATSARRSRASTTSSRAECRSTTPCSSPARTIRCGRQPGSRDVLGDSGGRSFMRHVELPWEPWGAAGRPRPSRGLARDHVPAAASGAAAPPEAARRPAPLRRQRVLVPREAARTLRPRVPPTTNPDYVRFFEHVFVPDELFFQTIIMNSPLRDTVENDDLRYLDWSREPAPAVFTRGRSARAARVRSALRAEVRRDGRLATCSTRLDRHARAGMTSSADDAVTVPVSAGRGARASRLGREQRERPIPPDRARCATCGRTASSVSRSR